MIRSYHWVLLRFWLKYRGYLQVTFLLVALTGYCVVLGKYALANFERVSQQNRNASQQQKQMFRYARQMTQTPMEVTSPPPDLAGLEAELLARRRQVSDTCAKYGLDRDGQPNAWEFFIDPKHHVVWCNVFKAASSTWMYNFNLLGGYKDYYLRHSNKTPLVLARSHFPRPSVDQLRKSLPNSLSFLIVREPFERLLSAYRNKIESIRHRFYRKLAREMISKYRQPPKNLSQIKNKRTLESPTFGEFVSYVADSPRSNRAHHFDEHWAPYYTFCTPCRVNFTVVAKLETFDRDQEYIIKTARLGHILKRFSFRRNPKLVMNKARDGKSTKSLINKYYSQLTLDQLKGLLSIYGIDFEMFGYNATKYFDMVKKV